MASTLIQIRAQEVFSIDKCKEYIKTAEEENKTFLRRSLQARLVRLFNDLRNYSQAVQLASVLVRELKKVDDKELIIDVQLEESKAYYFLNNLSKARAALTSARTVANSKYVPPRTQAALDMQSGILHAADEKDFKTAFSYFYEAFEGYDSINDTDDAICALKYMLLSKIMLDVPDEISGILAGKTASKYSAVDLEAMRAVADSAKKRSLADFNQSFKKYQKELQMDPVVSKHFRLLSDNMLEKDLSRVVQPYSYVQLSHIASCVGLDKVTVEKKLAQMILDKKLFGSLHQDEREGMMLIVYEVTPPDTTYKLGTDTIHALSEVIDGLYVRAKKLKCNPTTGKTTDKENKTSSS